MAGAGYKLFNTGDVLTAAQVNTYLNEQTVMVFANSTARTTALSGVLAEGMMSYLQDTNSVEVYNGTSWVNVGNAGDLTEIVAGTGITVTSGTGPIPTVALTTPVSATNGGTAQSTYTTGDLLYASASNTLSKRAIGSTGDVLTVSGGIPTWAAPAGGGGGKVLQVVQGTLTTNAATTSASFVDTGITVSITPSSATSKVYITANFYADITRTGSTTSNFGDYNLLRTSTVLQNHQPGLANMASATDNTILACVSFSYLDSPSTTSSTTYKIQHRVPLANQTSTVTAGATRIASIIVWEIGA